MDSLSDIKKLDADDIIDPASLKLTSKRLKIDISMLLTWRKEYILAKFTENKKSMINLASSLSIKFPERDIKNSIRKWIEAKNNIEKNNYILRPDYSGFISQKKRRDIIDESFKMKTEQEIAETDIMASLDWIFNNEHILGKKEVSYLQIANSKTVLGFIKANDNYADDTEDDSDIEEED